MTTPIHVLQLSKNGARRIALVQNSRAILLADFSSLYDLASAAIEKNCTIAALVEETSRGEELDYDAIYNGDSGWQILPAFDHPHEPARCLVTGTGLTHVASARNRDAMHEKAQREAGSTPGAAHEPLTDSMKMFQWGVEGGKPEAGKIGAAPEWFYKGTGDILRGHNQPLEIPSYAHGGGEEPEIAGLYIIAPNGKPFRVGYATANEFSDHPLEEKNYLYLAPSKLRHASIGPEAILGANLQNVDGTVSIEREAGVLWSAGIASGEENMCHTPANLEHHHFKYAAHRRPGDVHVHFFGADAFSFGAGVKVQSGDVAVVKWNGLGRALRNPIVADESSNELVQVGVL
jgi:hypothetical protein